MFVVLFELSFFPTFDFSYLLSYSSSEEDVNVKDKDCYDSEDDFDSDESLTLSLGKRKKKQNEKKKKPGRKSRWSREAIDDLIDIIVSDDKFKTKLIFQNTKNQQNRMLYESILRELKKRGEERGEEITFSVPQLRTKFKKCVGECKKAALVIKNATGIKRFQDSKDYSAWFSQLFAVVKTRDSCQPDQAIEPSTSKSSTTGATGTKDEKSKNAKEQLFVPSKGSNRKKQDNSAEAVKLLKQVIEGETTKNVIDCMREEMEKSREHEMKLFQMMCQTFSSHVQQNPRQEYVHQTITGVTEHAPHSFPSQFNQVQRPSTSFINQGFGNDFHVLQPVFQPSGTQPFSASLPLSSESPTFCSGSKNGS